jgi:hypothetical protein
MPSVKVKKKSFDIEYALSLASPLLSNFDFSLLSDIVKEWFLFPTLSSCLSHWKSFKQLCSYSFSSKLHILLFNVRGLDERWKEVLLLIAKYKIDSLILTEVGAFDFSLFQQAFSNYKYFYQKGEDSFDTLKGHFGKSNYTIW